MKKTLVLFCLLSFLSVVGCTSEVLSRSTPLSGPQVPPKPKDSTIDVYDKGKDVDKEYEKLCRIEGEVVEPSTVHFGVSDVLERAVKPEARKCGADAIIIRKVESRVGTQRYKKVTAIAILYTDQPAGKSPK